MEKSTILGWVKNLSPIQVSERETISMKEYKAIQKKMRELEIENEILKNYRHIPKRSITEKFARSTYYEAPVGVPSNKGQEYLEFSAEAKRFSEENKKRYGAIKIHRKISWSIGVYNVTCSTRVCALLWLKSIISREFTVHIYFTKLD